MVGDLWAEIEQTLEDLDLALKESRIRGLVWAQKKAAYYTAKDIAAIRLKQAGETASMVAVRVKGEPEVAQAMREMDVAEVLYDNAREARNVYKKRLDTLREEYEREWSRAGMSN